ncbi:MAG: hypothetical protein HMLIMOIP_001869 [Candidatus Nitrosomirales archaeon]|jgi:hypothetical protein
MPIALSPTKIKQTLYLLVPKSIVRLVDLNDDSQLYLSVKKVRNRYVLEYSIEIPKQEQQS